MGKDELKQFVQKIQQRLSQAEEVLDSMDEGGGNETVEEFEETKDSLSQVLRRLVAISRF